MKSTTGTGVEIAEKTMLTLASTPLKSASKILMIVPICCCCAKYEKNLEILPYVKKSSSFLTTAKKWTD